MVKKTSSPLAVSLPKVIHARNANHVRRREGAHLAPAPPANSSACQAHSTLFTKPRGLRAERRVGQTGGPCLLLHVVLALKHSCKMELALPCTPDGDAWLAAATTQKTSKAHNKTNFGFEPGTAG